MHPLYPPGSGPLGSVPYYCEENIWRLAAAREFRGRRAWAVFVFGAYGSVAVRRQRGAGADPEGLVLWDYHVFLAAADPYPAIYDFDTTLRFGEPAASYLEQCFDPERCMGYYAPLFRPVPAEAYAADFDSDRSHMLLADGTYAAPPPLWPRPEATDATRALGLARLLDPAARIPGCPGEGVPLDLEGFRSFLAR